MEMIWSRRRRRGRQPGPGGGGGGTDRGGNGVPAKPARVRERRRGEWAGGLAIFVLTEPDSDVAVSALVAGQNQVQVS